MATAQWTLDPTHSSIQFRVKHLMITNVHGSFSDFGVTAESDDDAFSNPRVVFTAKTASISTQNEQRDGHLKGADFFDVEQYPEIRFVSTGAAKDADGDIALSGNLTIRDVTQPVTVKAEFAGVAKDPWGNTKAGFTITGKIDRTQFGLNWNAALEAGGVLVGEEIRLSAEIQLVKG
jgi:polyisoprenoid-binding protein YceI